MSMEYYGWQDAAFVIGYSELVELLASNGASIGDGFEDSLLEFFSFYDDGNCLGYELNMLNGAPREFGERAFANEEKGDYNMCDGLLVLWSQREPCLFAPTYASPYEMVDAFAAALAESNDEYIGMIDKSTIASHLVNLSVATYC